MAHPKQLTIPIWIPFLAFFLLWTQNGHTQSSADSIEMDDASIVAFVNVAILSMQNEEVLYEQTVITLGDRIESIGPVNTQSIPSKAKVIDGSGQFLIPGLVDMHVHVDVPFENGPLFLNAGITTALSLGTRARASTTAQAWQKVLDERERSRSPDFIGPMLYTVGPQIKGGETPEEVERIVHENEKGDFDFVKVHGDVSSEAFDRLNNTAKKLGKRVTGHGQRHRGMQPVYEHQQDLVHIEEFLYAAFNPRTPELWVAIYGGLLMLIFFSLTIVVWWLGSLRRRSPNHESPTLFSDSPRVRRWFRIFTRLAWLLIIGLVLTVTDPFAGVFAGKTLAISLLFVLMLIVVCVAVVLTMKIRAFWREDMGTIWNRANLVLVVAFIWTFVTCTGFLIPRSWRTTESAMERIAQETAAAGIWVTPNLVSLDNIKRHNTDDEFYKLIQRPEMRYLRPAIRDHWINHNRYRQFPGPMRPMQFAIWQNWTRLTSRLTKALHEANVPLLAGSDATGPDGLLPGSSLHDELGLLVQAGLSPYEALRTATVNPAIYLNDKQEFGKIITGFRADLVLLADNPLDDIDNIKTQVGVMKHGHWFSSDELEAALEKLAEQRK